AGRSEDSARKTWPSLLPPGSSSHYLKYLPAVFGSDQQGRFLAPNSDFLGRYLLIFESIWEPLEQRQDHIEAYFNPQMCPATFLTWMARWFDLAFDASWPEARRRNLLAHAGHLYRWRGTPHGLARMIEVCLGLKARISEEPDQPWVVRIAVTIPA